MEYILDEKGNKTNRQKPIKYIINNNCWECTSHSRLYNYPYTGRNKKQLRMNRYVYELYKGKIPEGYVVMHTCDNPSCINPEHLEAGTQADNINDMMKKNRNKTSKGVKRSEETKNKQRKLKKEQAEEIKLILIEGNLSQKDIAKKFNISEHIISDIVKGNSTYSKLLNGGLKNWIDNENIKPGKVNLSLKQCFEIKKIILEKYKEYNFNELDKIISKMYNVSTRTISRVRTGNYKFSKELNGGFKEWLDI